MSTQHYDVIVIGGGIHGAGVAQAVAAAGHSVLLIEKDQLGSETSSKSSKLIHGGLRYLENFHFALVRLCLNERTILLQNAPDIVKLVPFYIPVYKTSTRRPWKIRAGLILYNLLSGFNSPYKKIPVSQWNSLNSLALENLQAVFQYYDAQTDDVLLTQAVAKSAKSLGAKVHLGEEMINAEVSGSKVVLNTSYNGKASNYHCNVLVNAAGAAVNNVLSKCSPEQVALDIEWVQGAHILIDSPAKAGVYYLEARTDHRAVFAMPWNGFTLVGTTETRIESHDVDVKPTSEEIDYLLSVYNDYFPSEKKTMENIIESFAGLRVLPKEEGSVFSRNRDTVLHVDSEDNPRILTIYGGKLTAYRATAEKVFTKISGSLSANIVVDTPEGKFVAASTKNLPLNN